MKEEEEAMKMHRNPVIVIGIHPALKTQNTARRTIRWQNELRLGSTR